MICSLQVKCIIIIIIIIIHNYVDLLLLVTMNKIISSYKWEIAQMPLFFELEWNYIMKFRI